MRKLKTINLSGKQYAQVSERLRAIHEDYKDFDIDTTYELLEKGVIFTGIVTIRNEGASRKYTGHSYGANAGAKAFEKLETIAVGRALAFAGYHADGEIASVEEMQEHVNAIDLEAISNAIDQIKATKSVDDLKTVYRGMSIEMKQNKEVIDAGKAHKSELTTIQV